MRHINFRGVRVVCYHNITRQKMNSLSYISSSVFRNQKLQRVQKAEEDDQDFGIFISENHVRKMSTITLKNELGEHKGRRTV